MTAVRASHCQTTNKCLSMEIEHPYKSTYSDLSKGVQNKVVLITGAASGIGRSATIEYLKLGCV